MIKMNEIKLNGQSKDIVSDNVSKLKEIFPEVITEDKVDFEKLQSILGKDVDDSKEKYSFTWPGKTQAIHESQKQSTGTLRPCREESKNWDTTQNLYIEGDNLEVLKLLQKSYYGKIKCIYIDPPYNTGKDFIYSDNYQDNLMNYLEISGQVLSSEGERESIGIKLTNNPETAGRYHSNWLNMMYPRIKLARNLLSDDGILYISIDENEIENLKKLCNEIFGEENVVATLIWKSKSGGANDSKFFAIDHEYIICCSKNYNVLKLNLDTEVKVSTSYNNRDEKGQYALERLDKQSIQYSKGMDYEIVGPDGKIYKPLHKNPEKPNATWRWGRETVKQRYDELVFKDGKVYTKNYKKEGAIPRSLLIEDRFGRTRTGKTDFSELIENNVFSSPKPKKLIKFLLNISVNDGDFVLDFFSGSATTANAILEFNNDKQKNIKHILIQIPEKTDEKSNAFKDGFETICEIGKERIRRAGDKIVEESGNKDLDIGFKVFKLDSSNLEKWDSDYNNLQQSLTIDNIKKDRTNEDLVYEIMLKYGIDLTYPIQQENNIYSIGYGALVICLDDNITKDITNDILRFTNDSSTSRVVFKDSGFKSDAEKVNIKEILKTNNIDEFITI